MGEAKLMPDLGRRLRDVREAAGMLLEELSARTKIKVSMLEAIERGELTRLPGGLFTRGFLRAYAHEVGLDPESVIDDYRAVYEPPPPPVAEAPPPEHTNPRLLVTPSVHRRWPLVLVTLIALMAVFTIARSARVGFELQPVATTGRSDVAPAAEQGSGTRREEQTVVSHAEVDKIALEIGAAGAVWVAATADGARAVYRIVQPGERETVNAQNEIVLRIGDAGAFQYSINGRPGRPLGGPSEVLDVRITRDNFHTFTERR